MPASGGFPSPPGRTPGKGLKKIADVKRQDAQDKNLQQKHHGHILEKKQDNVQKCNGQSNDLNQSGENIHIIVRSV
jgi:hypothetical protein